MTQNAAMPSHPDPRPKWARVGTFALLSLAGALLPASPLAAAHEDPAEMLKEVSSRRYDTEHYDEVLALCDRAAASPGATRDQKLQVYDVKLYILSRLQYYERAVAAMDEMRKSLPGDKDAERTALFKQMDICWRGSKPDLGLEKAAELIRVQPDNPQACAMAHVWMGRLHYRKRQYQESFDACQRALDLVPDDAKIGAQALWEMSTAAWAKNDMEACANRLALLMEPKYLETRPSYDRFSYRKRYGECLIRLERYDDAIAHFREREKEEPPGRYKQEWCLWVARAFAAARRHEEALAAYERVFIGYPDQSDFWYSAQVGIAAVLREQDKLDDAIQAARVGLDAARDRSSVINSTRFIAQCLKQKDVHVTRANHMINYQRFGPAGEDGKAGTDDDPQDPLDAFGYPSCPDRERVFADARKRAGQDAQAARHRALTYAFTGHPKEALEHLLDAFSRASGSDFKRIGQDLIVIGVRSARGHAVGLQPYVDFINFGPAGPDGKLGTADDLKDPFPALLE